MVDYAAIAYGIGAIIMAVERALRAAPTFRQKLPRFWASENWEFAPLLLLIVAAIIWGVRWWSGPVSSTTTQAASKAVQGILVGNQWRHLTATEKWELATALRAANGREKVVIVRYTNPDCEDLAQDIYDALQAAGWEQPFVPGLPISGNLQKGIAIRTWRNSGTAEELRTVLRDHLHYLLINEIVPDEMKKSDPLQIEIGNVPD